MDKRNDEEYINELEEKIIELSFILKNKKNELNIVCEANRKIMGKLIHNLKNPVGVIFSFSDMILGGLEDYDSEKLEKHVNVINKSSKFSIKLLNTLAKYSQLQLPDLKFDVKPLNYLELLDSVIDEFNSLVIEKNCTIEKKYPVNDIFLTLDGDEMKLALSNIINNALRYSEENTTITIAVSDLENTIDTLISDEGIGISEENLPFIFDEFNVVNTYSEDKQKCIGLGLTIASKIIDLHKGKLSITSVVNEGSNFKILLPKV